jgi:EAL and modified HD-GYP domain-containing signal transduction protein
MALARARFCELIAPALSAEPAQFYLLGLMSLLDVLFEMPLARILETVPLTPAMKTALMGDDGVASHTLDLVRGLESCDWLRCEKLQNQLGIAEGMIAARYAESLRWASTMLGDERS